MCDLRKWLVFTISSLLFTGTLALADDNILAENSRYQLGDEWGKVPVTATHIEEIPSLRAIAYGTARVGGATGFYLGKFAGVHVMATNHHVCGVTGNGCSGATFPFLKKHLQKVKFFGSWTEIDLALFAVRMSAEDEKFFAQYANPFAFDLPLHQEQALMTLGFGVANNTRRALVGNWDSDCKVFSQTDEYRFMADPDELNPGPYSTWSFANGCDISHGDSGSAVVDRESGRVVGIFWTGSIPKKPEVQKSENLDKILNSNDPKIWKLLSYAVPAAKIQEKFQSLLDSGSASGQFAEVLQDILN